jgi:hypothetical protein
MLEQWAIYLHHVLVHFPIVMPFVLGALGLWTRGGDDARVCSFLQWGGWATLALSTLVVVSGVVSAPGALGGEGSAALTHHRDLGVITWLIMAVAARSFHVGARDDERDRRMLGVTLWCVAAFAVVGAGHWGGSTNNPEKVPWDVEGVATEAPQRSRPTDSPSQ